MACEEEAKLGGGAVRVPEPSNVFASLSTSPSDTTRSLRRPRASSTRSLAARGEQPSLAESALGRHRGPCGEASGPLRSSATSASFERPPALEKAAAHRRAERAAHAFRRADNVASRAEGLPAVPTGSAPWERADEAMRSGARRRTRLSESLRKPKPSDARVPRLATTRPLGSDTRARRGEASRAAAHDAHPAPRAELNASARGTRQKGSAGRDSMQGALDATSGRCAPRSIPAGMPEPGRAPRAGARSARATGRLFLGSIGLDVHAFGHRSRDVDVRARGERSFAERVGRLSTRSRAVEHRDRPSRLSSFSLTCTARLLSLAIPSILSAALPVARALHGIPVETGRPQDVAMASSQFLRGGGQVCAPGRFRGGSSLKAFSDVWSDAAKKDMGAGDFTPKEEESKEESGDSKESGAENSSSSSSSVREPPASVIPLQSFVRVPIPGDGNCMFRAVAVGLAAAEGRPLPGGREQLAAAQALRDLVADALVAPGATDRHPGATFAVELDEPVTSYARRLRRPGFWGGEPELLVLSVELDREIRVYSPELASRGHGATGNQVVLRLLQTYPGGPGAPNRTCIRLLYVGGAHYEALLMPPSAKL